VDFGVLTRIGGVSIAMKFMPVLPSCVPKLAVSLMLLNAPDGYFLITQKGEWERARISPLKGDDILAQGFNPGYPSSKNAP
jgi:hypothetical protein